jgi:hypothetical protein
MEFNEIACTIKKSNTNGLEAKLLRHLDTVNKGSSDASVTMYPVKTLSLSAGGYIIVIDFKTNRFGVVRKDQY